MPKNKNDGSVHEGHRSRVKERFLKYGLDSFTEVQILEALLFYAVPKKDTNETAHLLIKTFGSLKNVIDAKYEELIKVKGIGENAASLIKFFQMGSKKYLELSFSDSKTKKYDTPKKLKQYCKQLFLGEKREMIYAIALDSELIITGKEALNTGAPDCVYLSYRKLTEFVHKNDTSRVVLTHNHPNGTEMVSRHDIDATREVAELLNQIGVELVDHLVVGRTGVTSMREEDIAKDVWDMFKNFEF